jgi:hypothetical protein
MDGLMATGNEDLIFKLEHGYRSWSKGAGNIHYEYSMKKNYPLVKEVWRKVLNFREEDTLIARPANAQPEVEPIEVVEAPPMDGKGGVPSEAFTPARYITAFPQESMWNFGKTYNGTVRIEFDLVFSPEIDSSCNNVIAFTAKTAPEIKYQQQPMLIQFYTGTVNVYSGSGYVNSVFPTAANYRYRFRLECNLNAKTYDVWLKPVYPEAADEAHIGKNCAFRASAPALASLGAVAMARESDDGLVWVENLTVNGDRIVKK